MQTERRVAANPQTKPIDLGCESAENWQLLSTSTIAIVIITQPGGGRLSRPSKVMVHSLCPRLYNRSGCRENITGITDSGVIRTWVLSHRSQTR